jgi:transposase
MGNKRRQYSAEFKQDAVNYYNSSEKTMEQVSKELKVSMSTLSKWISSATSNNGVVEHRGSGNYASDMEKEIAMLKKELRDKTDALEILKKAIGILRN